MADFEDRWEQNVPGEFFVDQTCIACDACVKEAPLSFKMNDIEGHAYVFFQPQSDNQVEQAIEALRLCPVEAIGRKED